MEQTEIIEGNKLIADFMGWHYNKSGQWSRKEDFVIIDGEEYSEKWERLLKFHTSWDWLMPVVEKIESLHDSVFSFFIVQDECDIALSSSYKENGEDWDAPNFAQRKGNKLLSTWSAVVDFIKWYQQCPTSTK